MKKKVSIREMFQLMVDAGLTPNQCYVLCCMKESIVPAKAINIHNELRALGLGEWVINGALTPKAEEVLSKIGGLFEVQKKKTTKELMGEDYADRITKYLDLWDMGKLPSGKPARVAKSNVETAFKWFFENHDYDWDLIMKATVAYINEYEGKSPKYMYMRNSQYFIRKQVSDKSWSSDLADYCENIKNGTDQSKSNHFSENVV